MAVASLKVPIDPAALIRIKIFQARRFLMLQCTPCKPSFLVTSGVVE